MDQDRNLLFGVFAVQLRKVNPSQIMEAAGAWASNPEKDLPDRLVGDHGLSDEDRRLIDRLVEEAVDAHDGDAAATLVSFGGATQVQQSFYGSVMIKPDGGVETVIAEPSSDTQSLGVEESPGRYSQVGETARGGMGRILLVHDEFLGRDVALKELLPGLVPASDAPRPELSPAREGMSLLSRFLQEARVTGQLEHPSIVPVYELGHRSDGTIYYTMKLVRGDTFEDAIASARNLEGRLRLLPHFIDLCQGIAYAHSLKVIHRDIKPSNVMVGKFGETVILDWGLAKLKDKEDVHSEEIKETLRMMNLGDVEAISKTAHGEVMGTPLYMPPEQAKGQLDQVDERSDVYSLGAVLYELLTGVPLFPVGPVKRILEQVVNEEPRPIGDLVSDVPVELAAICEKAISKNPEQRYDSAGELAEEIQRFQSGALVQAHEYTAKQLASRFFRRNRTLVVTSAVAVAVILVIIAYYVSIITRTNGRLFDAYEDLWAKTIEAEAARSSAEEEAYITSIVLANRYVNDGQYSEARSTLDTAPKEQRGWEWAHLSRQSASAEKFLKIGETKLSALAQIPDSSQFVAASVDGSIARWDGQSGNHLQNYDGHKQIVSHLLVTPDGKFLVSGSYDKTIKIWELATGELRHTLTTHERRVQHLAISPDGTTLLSSSGDKTARVWDVRLGNELFVLRGHEDWVRHGAFDPDGKRVLTASDDGTAKLWSVTDGALLQTMQEHTDGVRMVAFFPDGKRFLTASKDGQAIVWDDAKFVPALRIGGDGDSLELARISPDGSVVLTIDEDDSAQLFDARAGTSIREWSPHDEEIHDAFFEPSGGTFFTVSDDATAKQWDVTSGKLTRVLAGHEEPVVAVTLNAEGTRLLTGSADGIVGVWQTHRSSNEQVRVFAHEGIAYCLRYSPNGRNVLTSGEDGCLRIWDASTGRLVLTLAGHDESVARVQYSPDGTRIASASFDGLGMVWDAKTGEPLVALSGHFGPVLAVAFSPDGNEVATGGVLDGSIRFWDVKTGVESAVINGVLGGPSDLVYHPHDSGISAGAASVMTRTFDRADQKLTHSYLGGVGEAGAEQTVDITSDGKYLLVPSSLRLARLIDLESKEDVVEYSGHRHPVLCAAFDEEEIRVATAEGILEEWDVESAKNDEFYEIKVWHRQSGRELTSVRIDAPASFVSFSPDGNQLAAVSEDGALRVWGPRIDQVDKSVDEDIPTASCIVAISESDLSEYLDRIVAIETVSDVDPNETNDGWSITNEFLEAGLVRFGIRMGDELLDIGGTAVSSAQDVISGFQKLSSTVRPFQMSIRTMGVLSNVEVRILAPSFYEQKPVPLDREEARKAIEEAIQLLKAIGDEVDGEESTLEESLPSGLIVGTNFEGHKVLRLLPGDQVREVNDIEITSLQDAITEFERQLALNESGQTYSVNIKFRRGNVPLSYEFIVR